MGAPAHATSPEHPKYFPLPEESGPEGLVAIGGVLESDWLVDAYRHGIFPWPDAAYEPMLWWSPNPRAIIELDGLHISRRLRRRLRSGRFTASCDQDFAGVIHGCATAPGRAGATWLTEDMIQAYLEMHRRGLAHSVEVWQSGQLVGGVYGVATGGAFAAESMFHRETDASKAAVAYLVAHLAARGFGLLDIQQWTSHTGSLGAVEIDRRDYLRRLRAEVDRPVIFGDGLTPVAW
ncbi:MAG: leucyl/phenylalanyl-tRNA--protein transferase [Planctomycetota bacterium]